MLPRPSPAAGQPAATVPLGSSRVTNRLGLVVVSTHHTYMPPRWSGTAPIVARLAVVVHTSAPSGGHAGSESPVERMCWARSAPAAEAAPSCHTAKVPKPPSLQAATTGIGVVVGRTATGSVLHPAVAGTTGSTEPTSSRAAGVRIVLRGLTLTSSYRREG